MRGCVFWVLEVRLFVLEKGNNLFPWTRRVCAHIWSGSRFLTDNTEQTNSFSSHPTHVNCGPDVGVKFQQINWRINKTKSWAFFYSHGTGTIFLTPSIMFTETATQMCFESSSPIVLRQRCEVGSSLVPMK